VVLGKRMQDESAQAVVEESKQEEKTDVAAEEVKQSE